MSVTLTVKKKFLIFPVNTYTPRKELIFEIGGEQVFDLAISLDNNAPTFLANIDVERFMGKEITLTVIPDMEITYYVSDEKISLPEKTDTRPYIHFTETSGWTNDPNGLYKYKGEYHLFYQHNPCDVTWANMHWGHAVSRDLVHWTELDEFLYPDSDGQAYSGGAYVDYENRSGLKSGNDAPIFLYYTAAPRDNCKTSVSYGKKWTQRILVSKDGGKTFEKLPEFVDEICQENRDPCVEYSPELKKYVMAIYLRGSDYAILTSENLINWEMLQTITLVGDDECPNLKRHRQDGTDEYKWVLYGAHSRYAVYEVKSGKFCEVQPSFAPNISTDAYAGQDFFDPDIKRRIKIDWIKSKRLLPSANFSQIFGIPIELKLIKNGKKYYLTQSPVKEITDLKRNTVTLTYAKPGDAVSVPSNTALLVTLTAKYTKGINAELYVQGRKIVIDTSKNEITSALSKAKISDTEATIDLTVIADRYTLEIFLDGGKFYTASIESSDSEISRVELLGDKLKDAELSVSELRV